jgi:hypothetical protein
MDTKKLLDSFYDLYSKGRKEENAPLNYIDFFQARHFLLMQVLEATEKEIVICSAIKTVTGLIIRGHRHCDCYHNLSQRPNHGLKETQCDEGFITSRNRYVSREEARQLQEAAGIPSADKGGYRGNILYSEDLY